MVVTTPSPLMSVAIMRDGYTVAAGGVDGRKCSRRYILPCYHSISFLLGKLYVYELRAIKSPKHVLEAHQGAVTCIAEQSHVKVGHLSTFLPPQKRACYLSLSQSSRGSFRKSSSKKSGWCTAQSVCAASTLHMLTCS